MITHKHESISQIFYPPLNIFGKSKQIASKKNENEAKKKLGVQL